jgi:hypothetical protein
MDTHQESMEANMNVWLKGNNTCLQKTLASQEKKELTTVEMANLVAHPEVPSEGAKV